MKKEMTLGEFVEQFANTTRAFALTRPREDFVRVTVDAQESLRCPLSDVVAVTF